MKFAHQSATIRQHGKGMIILETALETAGLTYVFPDGNGIKNIAFQVKRGEIEDLLGREPIKVNLDEILGYIKGKTVLVTGGGGSIGSEICTVANHYRYT